MLARLAVLLTLSSNDGRPLWSYRYTGTLPRLISFASHSSENTGSVGVFFPFRSSPHRSTARIAPFFSSTYGDPFCNPFIFKFMQEWGGRTPSSTLGPANDWTCSRFPIVISPLPATPMEPATQVLQTKDLRKIHGQG